MKTTNEVYFDNYLHMGAQQGWQCPVCGKVWAPYMPKCDCNGNPHYEVTTGTSSLDNKAVTLHYPDDFPSKACVNPDENTVNIYNGIKSEVIESKEGKHSKKN